MFKQKCQERSDSCFSYVNIFIGEEFKKLLIRIC